MRGLESPPRPQDGLPDLPMCERQGQSVRRDISARGLPRGVALSTSPIPASATACDDELHECNLSRILTGN
jgi:hypothetical protein